MPLDIIIEPRIRHLQHTVETYGVHPYRLLSLQHLECPIKHDSVKDDNKTKMEELHTV